MRKTSRRYFNVVRISDRTLATAKLEYETAPSSTRALAAKFGLSKSSMAEWVRKGGWVKYRSPLQTESQVDCDIGAEGREAEHTRPGRALAGETRRQVTGEEEPRYVTPGKPGVSITEGDRGVALAAEHPGQFAKVQKSCDRPRRLISGNRTALPRKLQPKPGAPETRDQSAEVVPFPGGQFAGSKPDTVPLPMRNKPEGAGLPTNLAGLRLRLVREIELLDRQEQRLEEYGHLIDLCLAPEDHLALDGLNETEREEKITAVQKAALVRLLPRQRDTLAGAIKTHMAALAATVQLKLKLAELARTHVPKDGADEAFSARLKELDLPALRKIREAQQLFWGPPASAAEPPKPPPPEPLPWEPRNRDGDLPADPRENAARGQ